MTVGGGGDGSARMLLSAVQGRRRLADLIDVAFEVPTPAGAPTGEATEPLTGSKQAAALFNQAADPVSFDVIVVVGGGGCGGDFLGTGRAVGGDMYQCGDFPR